MRRICLIAALLLLFGAAVDRCFAQSDAQKLGQLRTQARQGDARAQNELGLFYRDGRAGLAKDDVEATRLFKLSADQGEPWGQLNLGVMYAGGRGGLPKDDAEALLGATLVVYAAKDGETAEDGDGKNSPFTTSLLRRIQEPGIKINRVFRLVTGDVLRATANRQRPFVYGSLPGEDEYYFKLR